ncbi:MAG: hypothetical protein AAFR61_05710, partial [Bacteroidota bacterium]
LEKSLLFYHFNYKNSIESYSNIQLSILFRERGLYREAYYNLRKAEKVALEHDQFNVLEIIYDEMVKLAAHHEIDIEQVIQKRRQNQQKIEFLRANSEVLGMVTQQLMRRNYARSKGTESVIEMLEGVKNALEEHKDLFQSTSGKTMILRTVVAILIQKSAYHELGEYVRETFDEFDKHKHFNKENHSTRIMLRIWRINALQKQLRLKEAHTTIEALRKDLNMYNRQNFKEFAFHYFAPKIYNLKLTGELDEAGETLKEAFQHKEILQNEVHEIFLMISLADQYFSQGLYPKAVQKTREIIAHAGFKMLDEQIRFYVQLFCIVNEYESRQYETAASSYKSLKKRFRHLLKDEFYQKSSRFLDIIMRLNTAAIQEKRVFLKSAYKHFTADFPRSEIGGNQIILYEVYLKTKIQEEQSYYELLCEEVSRHQDQ